MDRAWTAMNLLAEPRFSGCEANDAERAELIRVYGLVQGVGFRPAVWRLAHRHQLRGWVANDEHGASIHACGAADRLDAFVRALATEAPPLARIERIERAPADVLPPDASFVIAPSHRAARPACTEVAPDVATCAECLHEVLNPAARRHRYPFTNCTHCGPRLSIIGAQPYDRAHTTMRSFAMCAQCAREYNDPADRRFHAQPIACPACGPRVWLERADGAALAVADAIDSVAELLCTGHIVAIKGLGGFQLACNACDEDAVSRLRARKHRSRKPFALMARDVDQLRRYCDIGATEQALLQSAVAPIVIMDRAAGAEIAASVAPGVTTLGAMLPNTPLHHLLLRTCERPIVLTSGNLADEPQCIANDDARARLARVADYFLMHDRDIERRVDDSVQRVVAGAPRMLRRARGYAPTPLPLPKGFADAPAVLAMGADLKNGFCVLRNGEAIVSHHIGEVTDARTRADYVRSIDDTLRLFEVRPAQIAIDLHPEYLSAKDGRDLATTRGLPLAGVQHHHAHIAACIAENGVALDTPAVLGVALDGLGFGDGGALWGGEFLLANYVRCDRAATFKPVAMLGGEQAIREPWRSTYAHLSAAIGWQRFAEEYARLDLHAFLRGKPLAALDSMLAARVNCPLASSCGRLFDAVAAAAAAGVCRGRALYEGQPAIEFEALVDRVTLEHEDDRLAYSFDLTPTTLPVIDPTPMWQALLADLQRATPAPVIAARFHKGLAIVIVNMIEQLRSRAVFDTVALSGGVWQNRVLLEQVLQRLAGSGLRVLTHRQVPSHDGGLALGQAVVAAARALKVRH